MQHRLFISSVVAVVLALFMGASAAAQSGSNARYYQFADTAAASVSSPASGRVRLFFDSTGFYWKNSAGTITAVGGTLSGLTTGVVPQAGSATTIVDSKLTTSGTNSGTWTLYDDTAVTGNTSLVVKGGAGQALDLFSGLDNAGTSRFGFNLGNYTLYIGGTGAVRIKGDGANALIFPAGGGPANIYADGFAEISAINLTLKWPTNSPTVGLGYGAAGILAVTDGSTGQGGIGIADSATNTVSDALILRHATSGTAAASFGTGLLFQGEDAAGNMQDMASIDAVYTDATNGSEDVDVVLRGFEAGAELEFMRFREGYMGTVASISINSIGGSIDLRSADVVYISPAGLGAGWVVGNPALAPYYTNTYDIGTSSAFVRNNYVSTSIQGTRTQAITDNAAAATFVTIAVPTSNTTVGGRIFYTITAIDAGTAIQTKTGTYSFGLNNIGGTVTGAGTDVLEHSQLSAGTLAPTFSVNISGTNAQFQLVLDTSLDAGAEVLKIEYRVQIDSGTATVTPAT